MRQPAPLPVVMVVVIIVVIRLKRNMDVVCSKFVLALLVKAIPLSSQFFLVLSQKIDLFGHAGKSAKNGGKNTKNRH
jgi:hypothetical protein